MKLIYVSILTVFFQLNSYALASDASLYASLQMNELIKPVSGITGLLRTLLKLTLSPIKILYQLTYNFLSGPDFLKNTGNSMQKSNIRL